MSKLDELINELCPDGVEFKPLWSVTIWDKKFNSVDRKKQSKVYNYPYLLAKDLFSLEAESGDVFLLSTGEQTGWTTEQLAGENMREGEVVTIPWGKSRAVVDCIKYYKGKFVTADNRIMTSINTNILSNKYLYYWIMTQGDLIDSFYRGSGIKHPDMAKILELSIPVPPLEVQSEIVRILDNFTELTAELTAELKARKQQYEHYRDSLLCPNENVKYKPLMDICKLVTGATPSKSTSAYWENGTIRWMSSGEVNLKKVFDTKERITELGYANASTTIVPVHSVVIALAGQGKTRGKVAITEVELCTNQSLCSIICGDELNYKYLYYYLDSKYEELRSISNGDGNRGGLSLRILNPYLVPVPSLEEQDRIVSILDRFFALCNDIFDGIPAEIDVRQKQYEYYRDLLLTFKEKTN